MTELKNIQIETSDGVAKITLSRPKHNVFDIEMMRDLNAGLENLLNDPQLKCLVFLGKGPSFCAGVEVNDHKPEKVDDMIATFNRIFELIDRFEVPTIAGVHGACLGGGLELAIACDIIVAADRAIFGQPEIKLGFFPPYAAIRLPSLVGQAKAIEICTTGKRYTAKEAKSMGFVSHTVEDEMFSEAVDKIANEIQVSSPLIIRLNKRAVKQHIGMEFSEALQGVGDLFLNTLMKTEDTFEGIRSFEEKRKPVWKNR
ncbi:MAG: enoyl-CoA hydratase/isomerase family protein [Desulfobacterales bacterium]|jgi:cyclohexa-1,5-dienecarbonyl-CoA hydratase|nr:enoyl-CoA hydratase [Desulfobacter sp.]MDP6395887.1 enoyl-CoA hydratase/isomerase family protein [Desulfobacterales bacterium]MDP6683352.1 enoyl-CoA hydratase/isomerase family protein [Desulfobacterales bacterium]MDP6808439.1 enoyl-CoA hydratase/isomerase family protein [Desulfobacterales bacterium]|tara:strand:- start:8575 stop:9345 length:771 start_codon:yes stop_codon:yes gene_type:complete